LLASGEQLDPTSGPTGVVATACLRRRTNATREAPAVASCRQPDTREGQAGPLGESERLIVPAKPLITVEGRSLSSRTTSQGLKAGRLA
jgi:hypothetical protein